MIEQYGVVVVAPLANFAEWRAGVPLKQPRWWKVSVEDLARLLALLSCGVEEVSTLVLPLSGVTVIWICDPWRRLERCALDNGLSTSVADGAVFCISPAFRCSLKASEEMNMVAGAVRTAQYEGVFLSARALPYRLRAS